MFIGGAIIAKNLAVNYGAEAKSDLCAFLAGAGCLLLSFLFIWMYNKKVEKTQKYNPVIVEILS